MSPTNREYSKNNDYIIDNKTKFNTYLRFGRKKDSINLD